MNHLDTNDNTATTMALDSVDGDGSTRIAGSDDGTSSVRCKHETTTSPIAAAPLVIDATHPNTFPNTHTAQLHAPPSGVAPQGVKVDETHDTEPASITADTLTTITSTSTISPSSSSTTSTTTTSTTSTTIMATAVEPSTSPISVSVVDDAPSSSTVSSLGADSEISLDLPTEASSEDVTAESQAVTDHDPAQVQGTQGSALPLPDPIKPCQLDLEENHHQGPVHSTPVPLAPQEHDGHDAHHVDHVHPHEDRAPSFPSGRLPSLNVQTKAKPDNYERPTSSISASSTSTSSSSSSSSLSDYLIIGQEPVERDDSEYDDDRGSERSMPTSRRSSSRDSSSSSSSSNGRQRRRDHAQEHEDYEASFGGEEEAYDQPTVEPFEFKHPRPHHSQRRITEAPAFTEEPQSFSRSSTPQSDRFRRRRSTKTEPEGSQDPSTASPEVAGGGILPALPTLKVPSVRGIVRSIAELVIASVICVTLVSCMFAFSYVSSGANHMLEWYADQRIGQRIRESIKEREHYVQEALEKMAGEEYARVKRRSQQFQQQQQQQRQQQQQHGNPYGQRYQQQYQQQREQRQREREQQQQQQQQRQEQRQEQQRQEQKKEGLSTAEWQELIQAASINFMARFTAAPTARGPPRR